MRNTSLTTVVADTFTAPRYVHHLVKVATGALVLLGAIVLLRVGLGVPARATWPSASLLSVVWFLSLRVAYWLDHRLDRFAEPLLSPDLACDLSLHVLPIALLLLHRPLGVVLLAACLVSYGLTYPDASP